MFVVVYTCMSVTMSSSSSSSTFMSMSVSTDMDVHGHGVDMDIHADKEMDKDTDKDMFEMKMVEIRYCSKTSLTGDPSSRSVGAAPPGSKRLTHWTSETVSWCEKMQGLDNIKFLGRG
jgi:hypothetical protein